MTAPSEPSSVQHVRGRMRWGHLALLTVLLLSGGATRALAGDSAEDAWWARFDRAAALRDAHEYGDASNAFAAAEQFAVAKRLDPNYVKASIAGQIECCHAVYDYVGLRDLSLHMLEVARKSGPSEDVFDTLLDLGYFENQLGDPLQALRWLEEAASLVGDRPAQAADVNLRVALAQNARGQFAYALEAAERAEQYFRMADDRANRVSALSILVQIYTSLGEHARARTCVEKAMALLGDEDAVACGDLLASLGTLRAGAGELVEAREAYAEARALFESENERLATANVIFLDARVLDREGELEASLALYEQAQSMAGPDSPVHAGMEVAIGWSLMRLGRHEEAHSRLRACYSKSSGSGDLRDAAAAAALLAVDHLRRGEDEDACKRMRESLDALAELSAGLAPLTRAQTREHHAFALARVEEAAFALVDSCASFELLDRTRATTITAGIGRSVAALPTADAEVEQARERVAATLSRQSAAFDAGVIALIGPAEQAWQEARAAYREALDRAQRASPTVRLREGGAALSLEAVQALLRPEDALVLYAFQGEELRAYVVEKEATRRIDVTRTEALWPHLTAVRDAMQHEGDVPSPAPLADMLIGKLELPDTVTRLLVSPDDVLAAVPFAWIAGAREVVFVPSATAYGLLQDERAWRGEGVLAMADPAYGAVPGGLAPGVRSGTLRRLEHSRDEALAITREKDVRLLGTDATEAALRRVLPTRTRWHSIHFACHGLLDEQQPAWSSLALTSSEEEDGLLSVIEVMGMHFPTDLAVLSACDTGLGARVAGEGMLGLASAFLYAGAPRVVASLWKVDDEATQAFMKVFYEAWNPEKPGDAKGAAEALRLAQRALQDSDRWSHPHYWAAWVLWGLPD